MLLFFMPSLTLTNVLIPAAILTLLVITIFVITYIAMGFIKMGNTDVNDDYDDDDEEDSFGDSKQSVIIRGKQYKVRKNWRTR